MPTAPTGVRHVLIVEDNPDHAFLVMRALRRGDPPFTAVTVEDGAGCLEMLGTLQPAAIVLDYQLPDMDGLALFARISALAPGVPVIFVTGMGSQQTAVSAMKLGAADYVVKEGEYYNDLPRIIALSVEHFQAKSEQIPEQAAQSFPTGPAPARILGWEDFSARAGADVAEAAASGRALSVLLVGLDELEANAARGSDAASSLDRDAALTIVAEALLRTVRDEDLVACHGPRSFAVLAQGAQQSGALRLAERVQAAIAERVEGGAAPFRATVSIGIAASVQMNSGLPELLRQAEESLVSAVQEGGNRVRASGASDLAAPSIAAAEGTAAVPAVAAGDLEAVRREGLAQLARAHGRGEIAGIGIATQTGACTTCLDAARDSYLPRFVPSLPLVGCTRPGGCRCTYEAPGGDGRRRPPPIPALSAGELDVPRKLRDAARFGSDPKGSCKPEDLAEYFERFPLLPFDVTLELHPGEAAYLARPARRAWEHPTAASGVIHGPEIPRHGPILPWIRNISKPPFLPGDAIPFREDGVLYLTNWRLIFAKRGALESWLLADLATIEYLRDGIGCVLGERSHRLVFLLRDPLQVGLYIIKAVRHLATL